MLPETINLDAVFLNNSYLTTISLPKATYLYATFRSCSTLKSIYAPLLETVSNATFYNCSNLSNLSFDNLKTIGPYAFYNCYNLSKVSFPNLLAIHSNAFYSCGLQEIDFPNVYSISTNAFRDNLSLISVNLRNCVTIGSYAFTSCNSLQTVIIPKAMTISSAAFWYCSSLSSLILYTKNCNLANSSVFMSTPLQSSDYAGYFGSIYVPQNALSYYKTANNWSYYSDRITSLDSSIENMNIFPYEFDSSDIAEIPQNKLNASIIWEYGCQRCNNLNSVSLPNCSLLESGAFSYCENLYNVYLPNCERVGNYAFAYCYSLTQISLDNCSYIESYAFRGCSSLQSVNLSKVSYIGEGAFQNCSSLNYFAPNSLLTKINGYVFNQVSSLKSITIPNVSYIGYGAFSQCINLSSVEAPLLTSIEGNAFEGCYNLKNIQELINNVSTIGYDAFGRTQVSGKLYIKAQSVYGRAFASCNFLTEAVFTQSKIKRLGETIFYKCDNLKTVYMLDFNDENTDLANSFAYASNLNSLYLLGNNFIKAQWRDILDGTPMHSTEYTGKYGSIYVRASLLDSYKNDYSWAYYSKRFVGLDDSQVSQILIDVFGQGGE